MEYKEIKQIIKDMEELKLGELAIEFPDGTKINMKKNLNGVEIGNSNNLHPQNTEVNIVKDKEPIIMEEKLGEDLKIIKSPMVGTFYSKSAPDKDVFVKVGDKIKKGDTLCIIEAMKLMNEIESEFDGEIVEVCVNDSGMVEYGMPLFKIK